MTKDKELLLKYEKSLVEKNNKLKYEKLKFSIEEKEKLLKEKKSLLEENMKLKKEVEILKPMLNKFTIGSQKL